MRGPGAEGRTEVPAESQESPAVVPVGVVREPEPQQSDITEAAAAPGPSGTAGSGQQTEQTAGDGRSGLRFLAEAAIAPSTLKAYRLAWKRWESYLTSSGKKLSGNGLDIEEFMFGCYQDGLSKASMSSTIAGISSMARVQGLTDPTKSFLVKKALKGWARLHPVPRDHRRPIDALLLARLFLIPGPNKDCIQNNNLWELEDILDLLTNVLIACLTLLHIYVYVNIKRKEFIQCEKKNVSTSCDIQVPQTQLSSAATQTDEGRPTLLQQHGEESEQVATQHVSQQVGLEETGRAGAVRQETQGAVVPQTQLSSAATQTDEGRPTLLQQHGEESEQVATQHVSQQVGLEEAGGAGAVQETQGAVVPQTQLSSAATQTDEGRPTLLQQHGEESEQVATQHLSQQVGLEEAGRAGADRQETQEAVEFSFDHGHNFNNSYSVPSISPHQLAIRNIPKLKIHFAKKTLEKVMMSIPRTVQMSMEMNEKSQTPPQIITSLQRCIKTKNGNGLIEFKGVNDFLNIRVIQNLESHIKQKHFHLFPEAPDSPSIALCPVEDTTMNPAEGDLSFMSSDTRKMLDFHPQALNISRTQESEINGFPTSPKTSQFPKHPKSQNSFHGIWHIYTNPLYENVLLSDIQPKDKTFTTFMDTEVVYSLSNGKITTRLCTNRDTRRKQSRGVLLNIFALFKKFQQTNMNPGHGQKAAPRTCDEVKCSLRKFMEHIEKTVHLPLLW
ncbi:uncharacterized protein LOC142149560 [Mixophyes fleayi]|uniref:uncharacterized protein LOC142149560 n=1 Tax=Mixophyes fleayi TaxID=3061075 RepID=UPI003F4D9889